MSERVNKRRVKMRKDDAAMDAVRQAIDNIKFVLDCIHEDIANAYAVDTPGKLLLKIATKTGVLLNTASKDVDDIMWGK